MIFTPITPAFTDERGQIADVLYAGRVDHVGLIESRPFALRGNHVHARTTQHTLVTDGALLYFWMESGKLKGRVVSKGQMATSPAGEPHAMLMLEQGAQIVVLSEGVRGGKDYESDTERVVIATLEQAMEFHREGRARK